MAYTIPKKRPSNKVVHALTTIDGKPWKGMTAGYGNARLVYHIRISYTGTGVKGPHVYEQRQALVAHTILFEFGREIEKVTGKKVRDLVIEVFLPMDATEPATLIVKDPPVL